MGKGDRERDKLRQERIEAEQRESRSGNSRLILAYAIGSTVVLAIAVLVFILATGGNGSGGGQGDAPINLKSHFRSTQRAHPHERRSLPPPPGQGTHPQNAAKKAGRKTWP